jgi:hypothetical protein
LPHLPTYGIPVFFLPKLCDTGKVLCGQGFIVPIKERIFCLLRREKSSVTAGVTFSLAGGMLYYFPKDPIQEN